MTKHHKHSKQPRRQKKNRNRRPHAKPKAASAPPPPVAALSSFDSQLKLDAKKLMTSPASETSSPQESNPFSLSSRVTLDAHGQAGQSDLPGDHKGVDIAMRSGELVVGFTGSIHTPQATSDGTMRDTATGYATVGIEKKNWGVYGHLGMQNGKALDLAYRAVDGMHHLEGMGDSRKSPASSDGGILAGVSGRYDKTVTSAPVGTSAKFNIHASAFGTAGTDRLSAGVSAFAVLSGKDDNFRPDLPHMPTTDNKGTSLYAGVIAEGVAYDLATDEVDTNPLQASLVVGGSMKLGKHATIGISAEHRLTNEIQSPKEKPVDMISAQLNLRF